jgi:uncharacterized protein YbgA (DUF1722 family)
VAGQILGRLDDARVARAFVSLIPCSQGQASDASSEEKQELPGRIEDYRQGLLPLIVPLT